MDRAKLRSLVYIPTNRLAVGAMRDVLSECRWATTREADSIVFCVIENLLDEETSKSHRVVLEQEAGDKILSLHLSEPRSEELVDAVIERAQAGPARDRLRHLLLPPSLSYGRGPNLASLLTSALGCALTHRRDSDVYLDHERPAAYPIELELVAAGRPLAELAGTVRRLDEFDAAPSAAVRVVGTSSVGAAPFDRRDLIAAGSEFLVDFQLLGRPGADRGTVASEALDYFLHVPATRHDEDFLEIDMDNRIEMQSCCFADIQWLLPEMPTDIIGCDYMAKDLVWRSREGLVFHGRKGEHRYDQIREAQTDLEAHVDYVLRDVQYLQFGRIWQIHSANLEPYWAANPGLDSFDGNTYMRSFASAARIGEPEMVEVRRGAAEVFASAAAATSGAVATRLQAVADAIDAAGAALDEHVRQSIDDYCYLIPWWPKLMTAAADVTVPTAWFN